MTGPYTGQPGKKAAVPTEFNTSLRSDLEKPEGYLPAPDLVTAVNAAVLLGQPLLLNGEPGTGKSALADAVAHELNLEPVLRVNCKADIRSVDLFYYFDHIRRLHEANDPDKRSTPPEDYVKLQGLGAAIVRAAGADAMAEPLRQGVPARPLGEIFPELNLGASAQSVVLIDEIDKASRDVPNDILVEIDTMRFDLPELGIRIQADTGRKPLVIITSNSEKSLPAPFLRRCVFYTIPFPALPHEEVPKTEGDRPPYTLEEIVVSRLRNLRGTALLTDGLDLFSRLRDNTRFEQRPSPAEFMNWLLYMRHHTGTETHPRSVADLVRKSVPILLKSDRDRRTGMVVIENWLRGD